MKIDGVLLSGAIPEPPLILCRDEGAQLVVMHNLHKEWARKPPTYIPEEWPEGWRHVNAVVITPINVLGVDRTTSFSIEGDEQLTEEERKVLTTYIRVCMTSAGTHVAYKDIVNAAGMNRRTVTACLRGLAEKGIGTYKYGQGFALDIGRWRPDAAKARAIGIKIEEK